MRSRDFGIILHSTFMLHCGCHFSIFPFLPPLPDILFFLLFAFCYASCSNSREPHSYTFIVEDTQLHQKLCPSVGPSVRDDRVEKVEKRAFLILIVYVCEWEGYGCGLEVGV